MYIFAIKQHKSINTAHHHTFSFHRVPQQGTQNTLEKIKC